METDEIPSSTFLSYIVQNKLALIDTIAHNIQNEIPFYQCWQVANIRDMIQSVVETVITHLYTPQKDVIAAKVDARLQFLYQQGLPHNQALHCLSVLHKNFFDVALDAVAQNIPDAKEGLRSFEQIYDIFIISAGHFYDRVLKQVHRNINVLRSCNEAMVQANGKMELLKHICQIVVEEGGYVLAWVGLINEETGKLDNFAAHTMCPVDNTAMNDWIYSILQNKNAPFNAALYTGEPCILTMLPKAPNAITAIESQPPCLYATFISLPLHYDQFTLGTFNIYAQEKDAFDSEEVALLSRLTENLAYSIVAFHKQHVIQQSETRLRSVVEISPDAIIVINQEGIVRFVNPAAEELFGQTSNEIINHEIGLPVIQGDKVELSILHRYATEYIVEMRVHEIEWEGEIAYITSFRDITSHKRIEQELEKRVAERTAIVQHATSKLLSELEEREKAQKALDESQSLLQGFLDHAPMVMYVKDLQGRLILTNQQCEKFFHTPQEQIVDKTDYELLPTTLAEEMRLTDQEVISTKSTIAKEVYIMHQPDIRTYIIVTFPIYNWRGKVYALGTIGTDITDRKRTEQELQEAWQAAEAGTRAKSEFLANMSHEIRTPMNAVIGMTSLLGDTELNPEQQDYLKTIKISGQALINLINDILDFSRIEARKLTIASSPFDLRECVQDALDLVATQATTKGLEIAYEMGLYIPSRVIGDEARIRQVLVNLLSNAVKFTESGAVLLLVEATEHTQSTNEMMYDHISYKCCFTVQDTGIGIPADSIETVFKPFSQVDTSHSRRYEGSGLGLSICHHLVEMMEGNISVESEYGKGSAFSFCLPFDTAPVTEQDNQSFNQTLFRGRKLLIISEQSTNRRIITQYCTFWHMVVGAYQSLDEARALESEESASSYDMVMLDMSPTDTQGSGIGSLLKQLAQTATFHSKQHGNLPPIIILAPVTLRNQIPEMFKTNALSLLLLVSKPIRPSHLAKTFNQILTGQQPAGTNLDKSHSPSTNLALAGNNRMKSTAKSDDKMANRHPLKILLTEDNIINQKVALRFLEKLGYKADLASNGKEALLSVAQHHYDIILMDIQMPEMDGITAMQYIRQNYPLSQQPRIVAMTAHAMKGDREKLLQTGMDDYISKPIHVEMLVDVLQRTPIRQNSSKHTDLESCINEHAVVEIAELSEHDTLPSEKQHVQTVENPIYYSTDISGMSSNMPILSQTTQGGEMNTGRSSSSLIDDEAFANFLMLMDDDPDEIQSFVELYVEDSSQHLTAIHQADGQNNLSEIAKLAHSLKSSSGQLGATDLADFCKKLEIAANEQNKDEVVHLIKEVESVHTDVVAELKRRAKMV